MALILSGCAGQPRMYEFDVTNCDPRERRNCISIKGEIISELNELYDENERLKAALNFCKKKL